jgi:predicted nucleotide-binding protein
VHLHYSVEVPTTFINYRYTDKATASVLFDALEDVFENSTFAALKSVQPGQRYGEKIEAALNRSDIFFALIGPEWHTLRDGEGKRLIDRRDDWVRREMMHAFARKIPVVPILLPGAIFPRASDLPRTLKGLAGLHYIALDGSSGQGFDAIIDYIVRTFPYLVPDRSRHPWADFVSQNTSSDDSGRASGDRRRVFVIHGRDDEVTKHMFALLRELDLNPQEWEPLVSATGNTLPSLLDVVSHGLSMGRAQAVVALLTPDDVVNLHPDLRDGHDPERERRLGMQPRPNVLVELGLALAAYRDRTVVIEFGKLRPVSNLAGLNVIRFDGSSTALGKIVERLKLAQCAVNDSGSDWRNTERFANLACYRRSPRTKAGSQALADSAS